MKVSLEDCPFFDACDNCPSGFGKAMPLDLWNQASIVTGQVEEWHTPFEIGRADAQEIRSWAEDAVIFGNTSDLPRGLILDTAVQTIQARAICEKEGTIHHYFDV